ncbi:MAG: DUF4339 domain-containing protein [Chlamydiae bacterium]|nr:DUF4339 domain-containing protein [Chlamydiota bacterium]
MTQLPSLQLLIPYFLCIGALTAYLAHHKRGRSPLWWFFLGFFFGLMALLTLYLLPKKTPETPAEQLPPEKPTILPPMTNRLWYFLDNQDNPVGPMSFSALKNKYTQGYLSKDSLVWNEELEKWTPLSDLKDYHDLITS